MDKGLALPTEATNRELYQEYLSDSFDKDVKLVGAAPMPGGFRNRLWRLDIAGMGSITVVVLRTQRASREPLVDEVYPHNIGLEFETLQVVRCIGLLVPEVWGLDEAGTRVGIPCFLMEFIQGVDLGETLRSGDHDSDELFLDAVCAMQAVTRDQLGPLADKFGRGSTARDSLTWIAEGFSRYTDDPLVSQVHHVLRQNMPTPLEPRFGNGDLSPSNILVRNGKIVGLIDFEFAGFFDPMLEFLAPFGWSLELRNRGLEERFCTRSGFEVELLQWYRAATLFGWWLGMLADPNADYLGYSVASCRSQLKMWIERQHGGT